MIGWKIMRYDPDTDTLVSGADSRIRFPAKSGARIAMPGQGIWLGLDRHYVEAHYLIHDHNALLELDFNPVCLNQGNISDRECEMSVPRAMIRSITILADPDAAQL